METDDLDVDLWPVDECQGLFLDALVVRSGMMFFASFWGRDTACQEFLARLSVATREGGLDGFTAGPHRASVGNVADLTKLTGRVPKGSIFGELVQMMIFHPLCQQPDKANRTAALLYEPNENQGPPMDRLWALIRETCPLPLLDEWQHAILDAFRAKGWLSEIPAVGRVRAHLIDLGDRKALEALMQDMVCAMRLRLPEEAA